MPEKRAERSEPNHTSARNCGDSLLNPRYFADGAVSGYAITGNLSAASLAAVGITPTGTAPEGTLFSFNNAFISASFQTSSTPEAPTWAMMALGFAGPGFAGYRKARAAASVV